MVLAHHVDEVDNDDAPQVAQAQLPRNGLRSFQVGFENGVVKIARTHVAAGVDVKGRQGLGLVHDQVAARFQFHAPPQRFGNFLVNGIQVKNGTLTFVVL